MARVIPKTLTEDEFLKVMKRASSRNKLAYAFGFYQGMRISEVLKMQRTDVDLNRKLLFIRQGKGGKDRNIPILKQMVGGIQGKLPIGIGIRALQIAFKKDVLRALGPDYKWVHFHTLRHSCATFLMNKLRWSTRQVQVFLGHSRVSTTEIYTHVNPQDLVDLVWGDEK